jgi:C4-dicarboxylate transporter DctM subunit
MMWVMFSAFVILLALHIPVAYALLSVSIGYLVWKWDIPFVVVAQQLGAGTDQFLLLSIPFFFLAGEFMSHGGITLRLVEVSRALVGHLRGGCGHMNVLASMLFSGISGSAVADMAAMGKIEINIMKAAGYPVAFAAAVTATSATLGPIIPPSIAMLIYASITDTSVGQLFLGGFLPGAVMGLFLMAAISVISWKRNYPREAWVGWLGLWNKVIQSIPVLILPLIVLGGIFGGLFTPTEAAIVSAAYAFLIGMWIGDLRLAHVPAILAKVAVESAQIMFILGVAALFGWIMAREAIPDQLVRVILTYDMGPWLFLLTINVLLLFLGCFLEPIAIMVIVIPVLLPAVKALGIDLVHFGVVVVLNLMIGMIHPPMGILIYIAMSIANVTLGSFLRELWPFLIAMILALAVVTYIPDVVLLLPKIFYR